TPSIGSLPARRARLALKQQAPERKKVIRRRATNGWRPLGVPVEKEVFVVVSTEDAMTPRDVGMVHTHTHIYTHTHTHTHIHTHTLTHTHTHIHTLTHTHT